MKGSTSVVTGWLGTFAIMVGSAGITAVFLSMILEGEAGPPEATTRTSGSTCVDALEGTSLSERNVGTASRAKRGLLHVMSEFYDKQPEDLSGVDVGCPSAPLPLTPGLEFVQGDPTNTTGLPCSGGGSYGLFVFVVPTLEDIDRLLGGTSRRLVPQEFACARIHDGALTTAQTSSAIYLTKEEVRENGSTFSDIVTEALCARRSYDLPNLCPDSGP
jgi:hypothetical protein